MQQITGKIAVVLLGLFLTDGIRAQDFRKDWAEGKLTWNDFSEKKGPLGVSELKYFLGYNTGKQRIGDTTLIRNVAESYMDKKMSWINPEFKTGQYLRYNQVIFDIVELYRRRLQHELNLVQSLLEIEGKFNYIYNSCNNEIDKFSDESYGGRNLNAIIAWEEKTSAELENNPDRKIPDFEDRNFGYAFHAGFGSGFFTGSLGEHFTPAFNFIFGFDLAYRKSILYLNGSLAVDKVKKDYLSDKNWYEGQRAKVAIIDVSYGYVLINNDKIKVSPFAGLGITEFSGENMDDVEDDLRIVDYDMIFGINADYKFRTRLNLVPDSYFGTREKLETSLRARLYITRANFYEDLSGYTVNLTIGLCGFGNNIRLK